mmetsp:Transcript_9803/g.21246  ORF Transcript_9803/g.21246 Transcript_9803/m.21246 type:complete len:1284 (+) Transcript_9803:172-4023(+)
MVQRRQSGMGYGGGCDYRCWNHHPTMIVFLFNFLLWLSFPNHNSLVQAQIPCVSSLDCDVALRLRGSECLEGVCSNPFHHGGCLHALLPRDDDDNHNHKNYIRTCHSGDPPEALERGDCRPSPLGYQEVRILALGWESSFLGAWILQILLSELLQVPVSIETGDPSLSDDFYDAASRLDYAWVDVQPALQRASDRGDCRSSTNMDHDDDGNHHNNNNVETKENDNSYIPCAHVSPEVWEADLPLYRLLVDSGAVEPPTGLGALVEQGTYVPLFVLERHPALGTYVGLRGEKHRHKLAELFPTPTRWFDYCTAVSDTNCTQPDDVAQRAPATTDEEESYFVADGLYNGYFRHLPEQNCTTHPTTCYGHFVDYPCSWASHVRQYTHWLNISLKSTGPDPAGGYSYMQLVQIWDAANATKTPVIMEWASSELNYQTYLGTDAEFTPVTLPPPTQECIDSRSEYRNRCEPDPDGMDHVGSSPLGACGNPPVTLYKALSTVLQQWASDPHQPMALWNPAHEAILKYRLSSLHIGQIFQTWNDLNIDKWGIDPRRATCQWVVDNFDLVKSFVPDSQPRAIVDVLDRTENYAGLYYSALVIACLAMFCCLATAVVTYLQRTKKTVRYAQVEFLLLVIVGLTSVSIGSLVMVLQPTDAVCVSIVWLINLGFTFELAPLIVKVAAFNRLMSAAQHMHRIKIQKSSLYGAVLLLAALVAGYLIAWTLVDSPHRAYELELTDVVNENGETIIERSSSCDYGDDIWITLGLSWRIVLLLSATVLAFQNRKLYRGWSEAKSLSIMVYSHFIFVMLRAFLHLLDAGMESTTLACVLAIANSCDVLATLTIYFLPKFVQSDLLITITSSSPASSKNAMINPSGISIEQQPLRHGRFDEESALSKSFEIGRSRIEDKSAMPSGSNEFPHVPPIQEEAHDENNNDDDEDPSHPRVPFIEVNSSTAALKQKLISDISETQLECDDEQEIVFVNADPEQRFSSIAEDSARLSSRASNAKLPTRAASLEDFDPSLEDDFESILHQSGDSSNETPFVPITNNLRGSSRSSMSSCKPLHRFPSIAEDSELEVLPEMDQTLLDSKPRSSGTKRNAKAPLRVTDENQDGDDDDDDDAASDDSTTIPSTDGMPTAMYKEPEERTESLTELASDATPSSPNNALRDDEAKMRSPGNAKQPVRIPSKNRSVGETDNDDNDHGGAQENEATNAVDDDDDEVTVEPPVVLERTPFLVPPSSSNAKIPNRIPSVAESTDGGLPPSLSSNSPLRPRMSSGGLLGVRASNGGNAE